MDYSKMKVLLTDGGARQTLTILHGLKKIGCHVTVICKDKWTVGYASKLPDKKIVDPRAVPAHEDFVPFLLETVQKENIDVLLPIAEMTTDAVTSHEEEFKKYVKLACAPRAAYEQAFDKQSTFETALDIGIPCPYTRRAGQDVEEYLQKATFPLIIKPRHGLGSIGFHKFETEQEFRKRLKDPDFDIDDYVLQEFVEFDKRIGTYAFVDQKNQICMSMAQDVLRWFPLDAGTAVLVRSVDAPEAIHYSCRLLQAMNWRGFANVGFMIDRHTGQPKLLEINGRITANVKLSYVCGFNLARQLVELACDEKVTRYADNKHFGVMVRHMQGDIPWFLKSRDRFRTKPSWFSWKNTKDLVYWKGDFKPWLVYTFAKVFGYKDAMEKRKHQ